MSPTDRTGHGTAGVDARLARLAPTVSPDPARLAAARAGLDAALDGVADRATSGTGGGTTAGTGPSRSRRVGDAHVLDLDPDPGEHDDLDDARLSRVDDDRVVPIGRGRTARERRQRRVRLGAAAAGVVGIVAVGLVLVPRPTPGPAAPVDSCAANLTASAVPEGADLDPAWTLLAQAQVDGTDLTLLRSPTTDMTGFCSEGGSTSTSTLWTTPPPEAADGEVAVGGVSHDEWYVAWGSVGSGARALRLFAEWPDEDGSGTSGRVVDMVLDGAGWSVVLPDDDVPPDARVSLLWQEYGVERSLPLDSGWPAKGEPATSLTEQRRRACAAGPDVSGMHPVVEQRHGDVGLTALMNDRRHLVACVQEADAPYDALTTLSGPASEAAPAHDGATAEIGGGDGARLMMMGSAGEDVVSVELKTEDGTVQAELSDGYWVAWSTDVIEEAWDEALLVWYLEDGSRHESEPFQ
ncbi:hypothetical protein ACH436_05635 [Isoptericola sp. NPDC019693]|uniref:hypothetical protein n=1 Tax=Isoptericola sp. NPDC019693 TaxID=3364009 RepID=UPI003789FECD